MSKKIIRVRLEISSNIQQFYTTGEVKLLHCAEDRDGSGEIDIWLEVDEIAWFNRVVYVGHPQPDYVTFYVAATGETVGDDWEHQGTVVMSNKRVWHIYKL